ncbi:hypothetical protein LCI18_006355 [Fusarium solani-melongenae]|uniref:Uncharacterized protein n=1 Tax=Fusarium solani subsp. cucurbitae TaxID=2747967 RepID=A0ACD3Z2I9_FUSSC|nr:hypothetical protein LCI18_006355 [Fusarium solani-melongenae]
MKSMASRAKRIVRRLRPSREQNPDCRLIQLPLDILVTVTEFLSEVDRHVLAKTCRAFWTYIRRRYGPISSLSKNQYLSYLVNISRSNPDLWTCELCTKLHRARHWTCPRHGPKNRYLASSSVKLSLQHRHVQLALKVDRLGNLDNRKLLDQLTMSHRATLSTCSTIRGAIKCRYTAYPKIIQGRYMVLSVWTYEQWSEPISQQAIALLSIGHHQKLNFTMAFVERDFWSDERQNLETEGRSSKPGNALRFAFELARQRPRTAVNGSCANCPVDFSVNFSPERMTVQAWHDFGPEGTPLNPAWMVHVMHPLLSPNNTLTVDHVEGSARELYES